MLAFIITSILYFKDTISYPALKKQIAVENKNSKRVHISYLHQTKQRKDKLIGQRI